MYALNVILNLKRIAQVLIWNLGSCLRIKSTSFIYRFLILIIITLFISPVYAEATPGVNLSGVTPESMIENIGKQIPNLMRMVTAIAYVSGMYLIISGVLQLKHFGEQRTMMSSEHSMKGPITFLVIGALLLYLPTSVVMGLSTFWTDPSPYSYLNQSDQWSDIFKVCYLIIQFVGTIAFIRGLFILSQLGSHGGHQGAFSKGLTHIIGGIFCINIYQFVQVILSTLGVPVS